MWRFEIALGGAFDRIVIKKRWEGNGSGSDSDRWKGESRVRGFRSGIRGAWERSRRCGSSERVQSTGMLTGEFFSFKRLSLFLLFHLSSSFLSFSNAFSLFLSFSTGSSVFHSFPTGFSPFICFSAVISLFPSFSIVFF